MADDRGAGGCSVSGSNSFGIRVQAVHSGRRSVLQDVREVAAPDGGRSRIGRRSVDSREPSPCTAVRDGPAGVGAGRTGRAYDKGSPNGGLQPSPSRRGPGRRSALLRGTCRAGRSVRCSEVSEGRRGVLMEDPALVVSVIYQLGTNAAFLFLCALGLIVILGMMNIINLAHGELMMMGAYVATLSVQAGIPFPIGVVLAFVVTAAFGAVLEQLVIRHFYGRELGALGGDLGHQPDSRSRHAAGLRTVPACHRDTGRIVLHRHLLGLRILADHDLPLLLSGIRPLVALSEDPSSACTPAPRCRTRRWRAALE